MKTQHLNAETKETSSSPHQSTLFKLNIINAHIKVLWRQHHNQSKLKNQHQSTLGRSCVGSTALFTSTTKELTAKTNNQLAYQSTLVALAG
jgi:hypothetical protein